MNLKIEVHPVDGVKRRVCVEVDATDVIREFDRAYSDMSRTMTVPGFRRGHVPRAVLEKRYGSQVSADVFERLIRSSLVEAIQSENLQPVGQPQVSTQTAHQGESLCYEATIEVQPEIELGDYSGVRVERPLETVGDEDVDRTLAALRESLAQLLPVTGREVIEDADVVMIDYEVRRAAQLLGRGENRQVVIGSNSLPPEFDRHLIGARIGEKLEFDAAAPAEEGAPPTEPMHFVVTARSLLRKELPPLDDEFAKDHGECGSIEELRQRLRQQLLSEAEQRADQSARAALLARLVEKHEFDVPDAMVEGRLEGLIEEVMRGWQQRGMRPKDSGQALEQVREELRPRARHQVKLSLLLGAIAHKEGLSVDDDAVEEHVHAIATHTQQPLERVHAAYGTPEARAFLRQRLLEQKASAWLSERAQFDTVMRSAVADAE